MLVRYYMSSTVISMDPDMSCLDAYNLLEKHGVRRAPVVEDGQLVGIVTQGDLVRRLPGTPAQASTKAGEAGIDTAVRRVMTADPITVKSSDTLESVAQKMVEHRIGGLPVTDRGKLSGIITESNVFRGLCKLLAFGTGCRIVIEEPQDAGEDGTDYVKLCLRYGCTVRGLLRHPLSSGGSMVYLNVEGGKVDKLVDAVWSQENQVISVER